MPCELLIRSVVLVCLGLSGRLFGQSNYEPYSFSTLAGGPSGASSVDGTCREARFSSPYGIDFDHSGNLYVADSNNQTIRKITPDCVVSTLAGSPGQFGTEDGIGSQARFGIPHGVAVGPDGNIYVVDAGTCVIRKITPSGAVTTIAGQPNVCGYQDGKANDALFRAPDGLAVDGNGTIWVADTSNHVIRKLTPDGNVTTFAGEGGVVGSNDGVGTEAHFKQTADIRIDAAGNLYIADRDNHTIRKIAPDAKVTTLAGSPGIAGNADGIGSSARFYYPQALAVDSSGNVYVADSANNTVRKITPAGVVTTVGGTPGAAAYVDNVGSAARFNFLRGISVRSSGALYIGDSFNRAVRIGLVSSQPLNFSVRLTIGNGDNVLIGGFIIHGVEPKNILIRGLGPSLVKAGVNGAVADPVLELHDSTATILTDDNWKDTQQNTIEATTIPPTDDREAAIVAVLSPGSYTVMERGNNTTTGVGLLELYDLSPASKSQLVNVSTRGLVGTGNNVMIGGFILGNHNGGSRILVRALGPSLFAAGVRDALPDPTLELHNSNGGTLASNDDWKDADEVNIQATGIPPNDDLESAIIATLPPGAYTAVIRGKNGETGVALVEFYSLP